MRNELDAGMLERVLIDGDLSKLSEADRLRYYEQVCASLGLSPLTKPFAYIRLNGKLVLYALKNCAEQLRKIHGVSVSDMRGELVGDSYIVTAKFTDKTGRTDQATGAVPVAGLKGEAYANALLKCETKCKNRGTYSIVGLGMLDETEVQTIPGAVAEGEPMPGLPPLPKRLSERAPPPALPAREAPRRLTATEVQASEPTPAMQAAAETIGRRIEDGALGPLEAALAASLAAAPAPDPLISRDEVGALHGAMWACLRESNIPATQENRTIARTAVKAWLGTELGIEHFEDCPAGAAYGRLREAIGRLIRDAFPAEAPR